MAKSHIPDEHDALIEYLGAIDAEGKAALKKRKPEWSRAHRLYRTGAPDTGGTTPLFQVNLLGPLIRRKAALLTENKPLLDVKPRREGLSQTARLLKGTIGAVWDEQNVAMILEDLALFTQVYASGFLYVGWDNEADYGLGNIALTAIAPYPEGNVLVDPGIRVARDLDYAQYLRIRKVVPLALAKRRFPWVADKLHAGGKISEVDDEDSTPGSGGSRIKSAVIEASQLGPTSATAVPRIELFEYWLIDPAENDDGPMYPNGRLIVRAGHDVICSKPEPEDQQNPYYDGRHPFEWLDNAPDLNSAWGRDELDAIRRVQETFNRMGNIYARLVTINAPPIVIADKNALDTPAINTLRDAGRLVIEKTAGRDVHHEPSPINPGALFQFMQYCQSLTEYITGLQDSGGGTGGAKGRVEVRSGAMLEGLQSASQVLIRAQARRLEAFLERVGQKFISRIFQFYSSDRLLTYVTDAERVKTFSFERDKLMKELIQLAAKRLHQEAQRVADHAAAEVAQEMAKQTGSIVDIPRQTVPAPIPDAEQVLATIKGAWREFRFRIVPFSSLAANRAMRAQMLQQLAQQFLIPSWKVLEELGFDDPKELLREAMDEAKERAALGIPPMAPPAPKGKSKPPPKQ